MFKDEDGKLPLFEVKFILDNLGEKPSPQEVARILEIIDDDNDGLVSLDDLNRWLHTDTGLEYEKKEDHEHDLHGGF